VDLVTEAVGKRGAQRAVDETSQQRGLLSCAALTTEEAAGNLAGCVHLFFDVDRQREEVALASGVRGGSRGENRRLAELRHDRASGLACETSGLEAEELSADLSFYEFRVRVHSDVPPVGPVRSRTIAGIVASVAHLRDLQERCQPWPIVSCKPTCGRRMWTEQVDLQLRTDRADAGSA
jgi:hypothetical protein